MISRKTAEKIHSLLIRKFGGLNGTRDSEALESALLRPFQTFESINLYPDPLYKAAAIIESIITNHPFIDGNKRTGYVLMRLFLNSNDLDITATEQEKFDFVISIASGNKTFEQIAEWLKTNTTNIENI
ncbi:MAG: type II toxin-antitoxin system death-on-curing family toxin [Parafilimonas sp.]